MKDRRDLKDFTIHDKPLFRQMFKTNVLTKSDKNIDIAGIVDTRENTKFSEQHSRKRRGE